MNIWCKDFIMFDKEFFIELYHGWNFYDEEDDFCFCFQLFGLQFSATHFNIVLCNVGLSLNRY